jgi:hypothetical protein
MTKAFHRGVVFGVLTPLLFLGGVILWIYRHTRQVPFPVSRPREGEVTVRLIYPEEVPSYWKPWRAELEPLLARLRAILAQLHERYSEISQSAWPR